MKIQARVIENDLIRVRLVNVGAKGEKGEKGDKGLDGRDGRDGIDGRNGKDFQIIEVAELPQDPNTYTIYIYDNRSYYWNGTEYSLMIKDYALDTSLIKEEFSKKVDKVKGKGLSSNDYDNAAKAKVDAIPDDAKFTDTVYVHPDNHDADIITENENKRFVSDAEKAKWNDKVDKVTGKGLSSNDYDNAAKAKVDAIPDDAKFTDTVYVHPDNHDADIITENENKRFVSDAEKAKWNDKVDKVTGKGLSSNDYDNAAKAKVDAIPDDAKFTDTVYTPPKSYPASMITESSTKRFVTDAEKANWSAKQNALGFTPENSSKKGVANGYASLDAQGKVPANQLPSYVDDVIEYASLAKLPTSGESGKIYVTTDTNKTYRWSGTSYVEISASLALGTSSSTAFAGDKGQAAYNHTTSRNNPHGVTKSQVGLGNVNNYGIATQTESETGTSNSKYMTPLQTKYAIIKLAPKPDISIDDVYDVVNESLFGFEKTIDRDFIIINTNITNINAEISSIKTEQTTQNKNIANKVDKVIGKGLSTNDYDATAKAKVDAIPTNPKYTDTIYSHPSSHPASMITTDSNRRFVSDSEKSTWNNKVDKITGKGLSTNDYTNADKAKVTAIPENPKYTDTVYSHPNTHSAEMITESSNKKFVTPTEKARWNNKQDKIETALESDILAIINYGGATIDPPPSPGLDEM